MNFQTLSFIFNRALSLIFSKKKLLLVFFILALSGLLVVFFRGLSLYANEWVQLSSTFLPIFICTGILLSLGILLIRIYHDEVKRREINYWKTLSQSWDVLMGAPYFAIPIICSYLLLWMLLGIFLLLREIPGIGDFFDAVLAFAPFLISLGTLILCLFGLIILFFVAPVIALKGLERNTVFHLVIKKLEKDPFTNLILILIGLLPLVIITGLLSLSLILIDPLYLDDEHSLQTVVKWFFIMLPFTAFLTPAVIFFFNFSAEAHVLVQKQMNGEK